MSLNSPIQKIEKLTPLHRLQKNDLSDDELDVFDELEKAITFNEQLIILQYNPKKEVIAIRKQLNKFCENDMQYRMNPNFNDKKLISSQLVSILKKTK